VSKEDAIEVEASCRRERSGSLQPKSRAKRGISTIETLKELGE